MGMNKRYGHVLDPETWDYIAYILDFNSDRMYLSTGQVNQLIAWAHQYQAIWDAIGNQLYGAVYAMGDGALWEIHQTI